MGALPVASEVPGMHWDLVGPLPGVYCRYLKCRNKLRILQEGACMHLHMLPLGAGFLPSQLAGAVFGTLEGLQLHGMV